MKKINTAILNEIFLKSITEHFSVMENSYKNNKSLLYKIARKILLSLSKDGCIYLCGNGGSAADAQHIAAEFVGKFKKPRKPLKSYALNTNLSSITAIANDYDFKDIFSRQVSCFMNKEDILIGLSTSGNSMNVLNAIKEANKKKATTIAFLGNNGGLISKHAKINIIVNSKNTARIQESHLAFLHIICEIVDFYL